MMMPHRGFEPCFPLYFVILARSVLCGAAVSHGRPMTPESEDEVELYHHAEQSDAFASDALYRALVPAAGSRATTGRRQGESPSWDNVLALSHAQRCASQLRRQSELVSTQDRIAREFLVARRLLSNDHRQWARSWAREANPDRCVDRAAERIFYERCGDGRNNWRDARASSQAPGQRA